MKNEIEKALSAIHEAQTVRGVRRAAHIAYVDNHAPGGPDQTTLQLAIIARKNLLCNEPKVVRELRQSGFKFDTKENSTWKPEDRNHI